MVPRIYFSTKFDKVPFRTLTLWWLDHTYGPRVFHVNWFRKDTNGEFLWPGFGENMRVLKWIVDRANGHGVGKETPIGWVPRYADIDWTGLDFSEERFNALQKIDREAWRQEILSHEELFFDLKSHLPKELIYERELLICRM